MEEGDLAMANKDRDGSASGSDDDGRRRLAMANKDGGVGASGSDDDDGRR